MSFQDSENKSASAPAAANSTEQQSSASFSTHKTTKPDFIKKRKTKKICLLCKKGCMQITYKDVDILKNYLKKYNKILTHKISGNCLKHQHQITSSIKRARYIALLPFISR